MDVEAVGKHERLAFAHVRRDLASIDVALQMIGQKQHDDIALFRGGAHGGDFESSRFGFCLALASLVQADDHVQARIAQIKCMRMSLAAVADDGNGFPLKRSEAPILFVIALWHRLCVFIPFPAVLMLLRAPPRAEPVATSAAFYSRETWRRCRT